MATIGVIIRIFYKPKQKKLGEKPFGERGLGREKPQHEPSGANSALIGRKMQRLVRHLGDMR
jgi:hypothetical protein